MDRARKKKRSLFSPDAIMTMLHQELSRDLESMSEVTIDPVAFEYIRRQQEASFFKKYVPEDTSKQDVLEAQAFAAFIANNERLAGITFPQLPNRLSTTSSDMERMLVRARTLCHLVLGDVEVDEWFAACKNSKGSSRGVPLVDTSPERKFSYPISCTLGAKPFFEQYLAWDQSLKYAIEELNADHHVGDRYEVVEGSRATTVDKSDTKRRMIAIEPTANMFLQQGLMEVMYGRLRAFGLDVQTLPSMHTTLAWESSVTGKNATIDFSSASDCVHTELLRLLLPSRWFRLLNSIRSHTMEINSTLLDLTTFATMGNACTFPLETLVFWSLAAASGTLSVKTNTALVSEAVRSRVSVFGDDCILPCDWASTYVQSMEALGFIINTDKSFADPAGRFRESCGGDYLAGRDVRPYYPKGPTSRRMSALEPWLYVHANSLMTLYKKVVGLHKYVYYTRALAYIFRVINQHGYKLKLVPDYYPDDAGLKVYGDAPRFTSVYSEFNYSKITRSHHGTFTFDYCRFVYRSTRPLDHGVRYALWLKSTLRESRPTELDRILSDPLRKVNEDRYSIKRLGGYVAAKSISSHWDLRAWKPGAV